MNKCRLLDPLSCLMQIRHFFDSCCGIGVGCAGFAKTNVSLQSDTKPDQIRSACVSQANAKKLVFASFRSNISFPTKAKLKRFFALHRFQQFFVSLPIFCSASKRNEISVFCIVSLRSKTK